MTQLLEEYDAGMYLRAVLHRLQVLGVRPEPLHYTVRISHAYQRAEPGRKNALELAPLEQVSSMNLREATVALVRVVRHLALRNIPLHVVLKGVQHITGN